MLLPVPVEAPDSSDFFKPREVVVELMLTMLLDDLTCLVAVVAVGGASRSGDLNGTKPLTGVSSCIGEPGGKNPSPAAMDAEVGRAEWRLECRAATTEAAEVEVARVASSGRRAIRLAPTPAATVRA